MIDHKKFIEDIDLVKDNIFDMSDENIKTIKDSIDKLLNEIDKKNIQKEIYTKGEKIFKKYFKYSKKKMAEFYELFNNMKVKKYYLSKSGEDFDCEVEFYKNNNHVIIGLSYYGYYDHGVDHFECYTIENGKKVKIAEFYDRYEDVEKKIHEKLDLKFVTCKKIQQLIDLQSCGNYD